MTDIQIELQIAAPIEAVWATLTDPATISQWMADDAVEVDLRIGGRYAFFGRETTGAFTEVQAPQVLEYTWRQSSWLGEWADSVVRWQLQADGAGTQVTLNHRQFPNDDERDSHHEGWYTYWLEPMHDWLENRL
jgi:uncharacterized protein YndB with AHSA1/START domain